MGAVPIWPAPLRVAVPAFAVALAALALASPAIAQTDVVQLSMSVDSGSLELDPGQEASTEVTLENGGSRPGTAQLSLDGAAAGWVASLSEEQVTVPPGGTETVIVAVQAPANRSSGAAETTLTVAGQMQDDSGQFSSADQVDVSAALTPAPAPPPEDEFPWAASLAGLAGLVAVSGAAWGLARRERGIELEADVGTEVRPGAESYAAVRVRNASGRPRSVELELDGLPERWGGGLNRGELELDAGEEVELWLAVKPPAEAAEATHRLSVTARPREAMLTRQTAELAIQVTDQATSPGNPSRTLVAPIGVDSPDPYEDHQVLEDD